MAVAAGALRVAQREVFRLLHAAIISRNRIRASKRIQGIFRRGINRRATAALVLVSDNAALTNEPVIRPPPIVAAQSDRDVDIQFAGTRATIPSIAAASARLHAAMRTDANRTALSTLPSASSFVDHIKNLS